MSFEILVLRLIHIVGGIFWVGTALFNTLYLAPALARAGPTTAGPVMANLQARRMMTVVPIVAVLTLLSGLRLMWIASAGDPHWFTHRPGHAYAISGALAIIGFAIGMAIVRPTASRMGKLAQSAVSDATSKELIAAEVRRLQRRMAMGNTVTVGLLLLASIGMAIARYL